MKQGGGECSEPNEIGWVNIVSRCSSSFRALHRSLTWESKRRFPLLRFAFRSQLRSLEPRGLCLWKGVLDLD